MISLSIHALFIGLAIGIEENATGLINLLIAVGIHKWADSGAIGIVTERYKNTKLWFLILILGF